MDQLLIMAPDGVIPNATVQSIDLRGWGITVTAEILAAKQLLQRGGIGVVLVDLTTDPAERMELTRFAHLWCSATRVMMIDFSRVAEADPDRSKLGRILNTLEEPRRGRRESASPYRLRPAQKRIANLVAQGYDNREIARMLNIKEQSVKNEVRLTFRKLGLRNRVDLAVLLHRSDQTPGTRTPPNRRRVPSSR